MFLSPPGNTSHPDSTPEFQQAPHPPSPIQHTLTVSDHVQEDMKASPEAVAERGKYGWNWNPFTVSVAA